MATRRSATPRHRRGVASLVGVVLLAGGLLAGCTGDEPPVDGATPSPRDAALQIDLVSGVRELTREDRDALQRHVGDVLTAYVVGAFLGDYPRDDFVAALQPFSSGVADSAAQDIDVLTASDYGDAEDVRARRLVAQVSAFTVEGRAEGATAHVRFSFVAEQPDGTRVPFRLAGRLGLVPERGSWRIFSYAVDRDDPDRQGAR